MLLRASTYQEVDALLALSGWLVDCAEHETQTFELPDLIRAHAIVVEVGRDPNLFAGLLRTLDRKALQLISANDDHYYGQLRRRPEWIRNALESRRRVRRTTLRLLAWFVEERSARLLAQPGSSQTLQRALTLARADAARAVAALHQIDETLP